MIYVQYDEAVREMAKGLTRFMGEEDAKHFAEIFAGNSLDGIYSHGMNRYPRYISDMESGLCDPKVTKAEKVGGFGALEVYDAHFGVGPLIAEYCCSHGVMLLNAQPGSEDVKSDKVLELNVNHPVFAVLKAAQEAGDADKVSKYSALLYAQAQLIEGLPVDDPAAYAEAVCSLMK